MLGAGTGGVGGAATARAFNTLNKEAALSEDEIMRAKVMEKLMKAQTDDKAQAHLQKKVTDAGFEEIKDPSLRDIIYDKNLNHAGNLSGWGGTLGGIGGALTGYFGARNSGAPRGGAILGGLAGGFGGGLLGSGAGYGTGTVLDKLLKTKPGAGQTDLTLDNKGDFQVNKEPAISRILQNAIPNFFVI